QDRLPGRDPARVAERLEGGAARGGDGRGLLEGEVGRPGGELVRAGAGALGEGAVADAEDRVADPEPRHLRADRLDRPGEVHAPDARLRRPEAEAGDA